MLIKKTYHKKQTKKQTTTKMLTNAKVTNILKCEEQISMNVHRNQFWQNSNNQGLSWFIQKEKKPYR